MPKPRATPISLLAAGLAVACFAGCRGEGEGAPPPADAPYAPPPERCDAPTSATAFAPCNVGGGIFGAWAVDDLGLPAFDYGLDQNADDRAVYPTTDGVSHRDHWAAFGNHRVNALASNDGYVEVVVQDRGVTYLDKLDPGDPDDPKAPRGRAGGYSYLDDGEATWTTAYKWRPRGSATTRRFGMGYAEATMLHRDVFVRRRTVAPHGDAPFVVDEVTLENRGATRRALRHYEPWDVTRRPIEIDWVVSGKALRGLPRTAASRRDARNALFAERVTWDAEARALVLRRAHAGPSAPPARDVPDAVDHYPADPFLAVLSGPVSDVYTRDASFWGDGDVGHPAAVAARAPGELAGGVSDAPESGDGQPRAFVVRSDLSLAPGESVTLRFAYGATSMGAKLPLEPSLADATRDLRREHGAALRDSLLYFATPKDPWLHRELAWHSAQIEASVGYREYWGTHVVPQGSAYLYLHGADGATRDTSLFALPLVYTHPDLAREQLVTTMGLAFADGGRFSYAFQGHGKLDDALGLHAAPSDLDLFFLLALHEYVGATGDVAFLDRRVSYWPKRPENEASARDHAKRAVRHLFDDVGFGPHGLLRVGTSDWSDGIVVAAPDRALAIAKGESVPNSQMALAVLPGVAELLRADDPALAGEIDQRLPALDAAVRATWVGDHYGRVYYGDGVLHGAGSVDLESQVWALLGPEEGQRRRALLGAIARDLDDPSPVGAPLTKGGQVWPAIAQLLTWGYAESDEARGWAHLAKTSLATRARTQPTVWFHVWSGPDGADAGDGATWASPVTPMTDFPTMNANVHAMAMLGALRVAGLSATARGLRVSPHVPHDELALRTRLVDLDVSHNGYSGTYRPAPGVPRNLTLGGKRAIAAVVVDGVAVAVPAGARSVDVPVAAGPGGVRFRVELAP